MDGKMLPRTFSNRAGAIADSARDLRDPDRAAHGTRFGCSARVLPQPSAPAPAMVVPRQRDRRLAISELLTALARTLADRTDISLIRGAFEEGVRRAVPVRTVHLRDRNGRGNDSWRIGPAE
jgi:hypothetical protein